MAKLTNTPLQTLSFDLERRKSFLFRVNVLHTDGSAVDITGCTLRFVLKGTEYDDDHFDVTNILVNSEADIAEPLKGYGIFSLQAAELDSEPGEYFFSLVLWTPDNFATVLSKGSINLLPNTESDSMHRLYTTATGAATIDAVLRGNVVVSITAGNLGVGPKGEPGIQGPQGLPGQIGMPGIQGPRGVQGLQGVPGNTGPPGATGPQGIPGPRGFVGEPGSQGPRGFVGETGPEGPTAVSADAGNAAELGTDDLLYVGGTAIATAVEDYLTANPPVGARNPAPPPAIICPTVTMLANAGGATWGVANDALMARFRVDVPTPMRYICARVAIQSGNIQVGVVALSGADHLTFTRVMSSGVIACPAAGNARIDCGETILQPGDYAVFLWCDNTTASLYWMSASNWLISSRQALLFNGASGVPATGAASFSAKTMIGLAVEASTA